MTQPERVPYLRMAGISKRFGGVVALKRVDFEVASGEVHALVGENGAGKSTLIKIVAGAYQPDEGRIEVGGRTVEMRSPAHAQSLGIAVMYQETSLYRDLSVVENLFVGRYQRTRFGLIDWRRMEQQALALFERLGVSVPLHAKLDDVGKAQMQIVEIAKALLRDARLLIMDEPTAALSEHEVQNLFTVIDGLRREGAAIIYISHRLEEIALIADRVTVLRDGQRAGDGLVAELAHADIVRMMVGRSLEQLYPRHIQARGEPLLEVRGLSRADKFQDISLTVHGGEIVALAGLVGSGRTEVVRAIFGIDRADAGEIRLRGRPLSRKPWDSVAAGLALIPEDRGRQGLVLPFEVCTNLSLAALRRLSPAGVVDRRAEQEVAGRLAEQLDIRPRRIELPTESLSGGNQQKVVLGKWLATEPSVLMLDEPTQGVDIGAKAEIHRLIDELVAQGHGVLLISSDLAELVGMADRLLVMRRGRIVRTLERGCTGTEVLISADTAGGALVH
jgi:ABC-type sugar transport system ATPase subunit